MTRSTMLGVLMALVVPTFAMSCSDEPEPFTENFPLCEPHTLRLAGDIDGEAIDVTLPNAGGGFSQDDNGGDFQYQGNSVSDPAETDLRLSWERGVLTGHVSPATGTLRMIDGPFPGQEFCVGDGTRFRIPKDDTLGIIQFELTGLHSGQGCTVAHTGTIKGCMRGE